MSTSLLQHITCSYCNKFLELAHPHINIMECPWCFNVNLIQDEMARSFTDYNIKNKFRLASVLKDIHCTLPDQPQVKRPVTGLVELVYNEGSVYFVYANAPQPVIFVHFEYQWYEARFTKEPVYIENPDRVKSGDVYQIFEQSSYVIHRDQSCKLSLAGAVFFPAPKEKRTVIEHIYQDQLYFSFWIGYVYVGSFELKECSIPISSTEFLHYPIQHTCSYCNHQQTIEGFPAIRSFVCNCNRTYSMEGFGDVVEQGKTKSYKIPFLPLNGLAFFDQHNYQLIGHCRKEDQDNFEWDEYTLWNKEQGFLYLSVFNGHWLKLNQIKLKHYVATSRLELANRVIEDDKTFELFNDYTAKYILSSGQFAGNIFNDGPFKGVEYTAAPQVWTFENVEQEGVAAFHGEHLSQQDLREAFGIYLELPDQKGIGMAEPIRFGMPVHRMITNLVLGFLLVLATQLLSNMFMKDQSVFQTRVIREPDLTFTPYTSSPFTLSKAYNNLELDVHADVNNSWFEADVELTNTATGDSYTTEIGVEYYSGNDGGESWSEGSTTENFIFSALPKGTYQCTITPIADGRVPPTFYEISCSTDVSMYKNFWLLLLILGIPVGIYAFYNYNQEYYRWSNSNYSPFDT